MAPPDSISRGTRKAIPQEPNICDVAGKPEVKSSRNQELDIFDLTVTDRIEDLFGYAKSPFTEGTGSEAKTNLIGNGDNQLTKPELQQIIAQSKKELAQTKDPQKQAEIRTRIGSAAQLLKNFDRFTNKGAILRFEDVEAVRERCNPTPAPPTEKW